MDAPEISVYGEAKGEYTRQLCVFLIPCLETYFLELLEQAKKESPSATKHLWQFQNLLQGIPDWNQDKVLRETEAIQKDCKCDYLEELLTAVFIAHTKVLSAIRLTTKQKKLQITIPKIDHFLHRVLADCARSLWTNAYLFAETNSIEKQKSLRKVSTLIQEAILQAIRGLLPVKSILREYLHEDDDEETPAASASASASPAEEAKPTVEEAKPAVEEAKPAVEEVKPAVEEVKPPAEEVKPVVEEVKPPAEELKPVAKEVKPPAEEVKPPAEEVKPVEGGKPPMIYIDTKPSVTFSQEHLMFDSNLLEANEIQDIPFAEAEEKKEEEEEEEEEEKEDTKSLVITSDYMPMDATDSEKLTD